MTLESNLNNQDYNVTEIANLIGTYFINNFQNDHETIHTTVLPSYHEIIDTPILPNNENTGLELLGYIDKLTLTSF